MKHESAAHALKSAYDSEDLRMFEAITEGILAALVGAEKYPLEVGVTEGLRLKIAAALFECAKDGEQDPGALKRRVFAQLQSAATAQRLRAE